MTRITQTLTHRQTQNLLLKPKMLQSLEMLAMPLLQLETHLKQEMVTNPMLELVEFKEDEDENETASETKVEEKEELSEQEKEEEELKKTLDETKELSEILDTYNDYYQENYSQNQYTEKVNLEQIIRAKENKKQNFILQLDRLHLNDDEYKFASELIDTVNDYGFLPDDFSITELAIEYQIAEQRAEEIHQLILHLEPAGITARNLPECLLTQVEDTRENREFRRLIAENFDDLIHKRYKKIANKFNISLKTVLNWKDLISKLDPKPGLRIQINQTNYIVPDVILKKIDNEYEIIINDFSFPKIRMSRRYREILRLVKKDRNAVEYIRSKINSAKFLIKSIYLRGRTLERVTKSIIRNQPEYFYENTGILQPLTYQLASRLYPFGSSPFPSLASSASRGAAR